MRHYIAKRFMSEQVQLFVVEMAHTLTTMDEVLDVALRTEGTPGGPTFIGEYSANVSADVEVDVLGPESCAAVVAQLIDSLTDDEIEQIRHLLP